MSPDSSVSLVIFGGSGDLAHRKLLPALYNLYVDGLLPPIAVVGVGRSEMSDDKYREFARDGISHFSRRPIDDKAWEKFAPQLHYTTGAIDAPTGLASLGARLDVIEHEGKLSGNRIYYLAIPPSLFEPTVQGLARARMVARGDQPFSRVIVEKPLGHDLDSACAINDAVAKVFDEKQIYRIDHYLGKETVQNILVLRFANSIFEPLLNQRFVDHVQITVAEEEGVGTRAGYYDHAGALRDMVQNHILQLLAVIAMEAPRSLEADAIRDEKLQVLQSLRAMDASTVDANTVRAQYDGYLGEKGVDPASRTETFVALQLFIDNWRWAGVPFFLRTGKRLPTRSSEIAVYLKDVPPVLFNANPKARLTSNVLSIRIQPDEGFSLEINSKVPGPHVMVEPVKMDFHYGSRFGTASPEAYERLLLDVMTGDPTLFMRRDVVEAAWRWVMPILARWESQTGAPLPTYEAGTWGPAAADSLVGATGRVWRTP
jgi:glucose-6-phosphate 1-dehydrogenase